MSAEKEKLSKEEKKALKEEAKAEKKKKAELNDHLRKLMAGRETWIYNYEGHEIKVVNKAVKAVMYIDGIEACKQEELISTHARFTAPIPDTDKTVIAIIETVSEFARALKAEREYLNRVIDLESIIDLDKEFNLSDYLKKELGECEGPFNCKFYICDAVPKEEIHHGYTDKKTDVFTEPTPEEKKMIQELRDADSASLTTAMLIGMLNS